MKRFREKVELVGTDAGVRTSSKLFKIAEWDVFSYRFRFLYFQFGLLFLRIIDLQTVDAERSEYSWNWTNLLINDPACLSFYNRLAFASF